MIMKNTIVLAVTALFSLTLAIGCRSLTSLIGIEKPQLRFGVLSDIHVQGFPNGDKNFREALQWYDKQKVDAVAITGDLTDYCMLVEFDRLIGTWNDVFKDNKRSDGEPVVPFMVTGNHDEEGVHYLFQHLYAIQSKRTLAAVNGKRFKYPQAVEIISNSFAKARDVVQYNLHPEQGKDILQDMDNYMDRVYQAGTNLALIHSFAHESQDIYTNTMKRLLANAMTWEGISNWWQNAFNEPYQTHRRIKIKGYDFVGIHWQVIGWRGEVENIKPFFETLDLPNDKPVFYFQHYHPSNTCHLGQIKSPKGSFDNGSSVAVLKNHPNLIAFSGHSHASIADERAIWQDTFTSVGCGTIRPGKEIIQGLLVSVYSDRIEIERIDFISKEPIAPKWTIPIKDNRVMKPFNHQLREENSSAPYFDKDAELEYAIEKYRLNLQIPAPQNGKNGGRFNHFEIAYETQTTNGAAATVVTKAYPKNIGRARKYWEDPTTVSLPINRFPLNTPFKITVTPISDWGKKGKQIRTEEIKY